MSISFHFGMYGVDISNMLTRRFTVHVGVAEVYLAVLKLYITAIFITRLLIVFICVLEYSQEPDVFPLKFHKYLKKFGVQVPLMSTCIRLNACTVYVVQYILVIVD